MHNPTHICNRNVIPMSYPVTSFEKRKIVPIDREDKIGQILCKQKLIFQPYGNQSYSK